MSDGQKRELHSRRREQLMQTETQAEVILVEIQQTFAIQTSMLDGSGEPYPGGVLGWTGDTDWGQMDTAPRAIRAGNKEGVCARRAGR